MNIVRVTLELVFAFLLITLLVACGGGFGEGDKGSSTVTMPATTGLLTSILISPATSSVAACVPTQFAATGYYSDGTSKNVTTQVFWQIDPATSSVAIADSANGSIIGVTAGSAIVSAWTGGGIAASAVLNVSGGTLNSIAITPVTSTIATTATQTYVASATCSNGTLNVSAYNIWTSSSASVATVGTYGLATAVASGSTVITATAGVVAASAVLNVQ